MQTNSIHAARRWQTLAAVLGVMLVVLIVISRVEAPREALGQVPDAGLQRQQMIRELESANKKLGEIAELLREIRDQKAEKPKPGPSK